MDKNAAAQAARPDAIAREQAAARAPDPEPPAPGPERPTPGPQAPTPGPQAPTPGPERRGPIQVLVAYSSREGATQGVAERIAAVLRQSGLQVELCTAAEAQRVAEYDAIVFGGAVYNQAWPLEGREFVRANITAMMERPTWLFSVGSFGDTKRMWGATVRREPKGVDDLRRQIGARDYRVFAGVIRRDQWPWYARLFFRALGGRFGDNRDWPQIEAFALRIAAAMGEPGAG